MLVPESFHPQERIASPLTRVQRTIQLEGESSVRLREGAQVEAEDIVAVSERPGRLHLIAASEALGIRPDQLAERLLVSVGDEVEVGQPLTRRAGLLRRRVLTAPIAGTLVEQTRGHLLIQPPPTEEEIRAALHGTIVSVTPGEALTIQSDGALVQGVWGHGPSGAGLLRLMATEPGEPLSPSLISAGLRGTILVAGTLAEEATLRELDNVGISGIVLGSLRGALLPFAREVSFPILLTDGFGNLPICEPLFRLLERLDGRNAMLSGRAPLQADHAHPALFVPMSGEARPARSPGPLAAGDRVRLLGAPYLGQTGTVQAATRRRIRLPNRLVTTACDVQLDSGDLVSIPYTNLERLLE